MKKITLAAIGLAMSATAAAAPGDMSVATFLSKAEALKAKGILALASSDIGVLKSEAKAAGTNYRKRLEADKAAKRTPHSCPPAKAAMNSDEFLAHLRSYPAADRPRISMNSAMADLMKKRFPCK